MVKKVFLIFIIAVYCILYTVYFLTPFVGPYSHSHLQFSIAARNFLERGITNLKFIPYVYPDQKYLNHPPLLYLVLAISYKIFGFNNWVGRAVPFLFSLGSAGFFYLIVKKYFAKKIALLSLFFYLTFPMFLFYGSFIQFEPLVLFFSLGSFYFLDCLLNDASEQSHRIALKKNGMAQKGIYLVLSSWFLVLGFLSDWSGLIFGTLIIIYLVIKKKRWLAFFYLLLITSYLLLYFSYLFSIGFTLTNLYSAYFARATQTNIFNFSFLLRIITVILIRFLLYFSPLIMISFFPILHTTYYILQLKIKGKLWIVLILLLFPLTNIVLLPGGTLTHPYFLFFFIPITALLCGLFLSLRGSPAKGGKTKQSRPGLLLPLRQLADRDRNDNLMSVLLLIQFLLSLFIFSLKIYQLKKYTWQYEVAKKTAEIIGNDQYFYKNWALDKELFYWYFKKLPMEKYPDKILNTYPNLSEFGSKKKTSNFAASRIDSNIKYYLFVCFPQCHKSDRKSLLELSQKYSWQKINIEIPSFVFNLKEKPKEEIILPSQDISYNNSVDFLGKIKKWFKIEQL